MKIFNWMHRHRFIYNVHSSDVSLNEDGSSGELIRRSGSSIRKDKTEKEPLLEPDVQAVENWELDGILTIGTLAIDPLGTVLNLQDEEGDNEEAEQSYNDYDHHENDEILLQSPECGIEMCKLYAHKLRNVATKCNSEIEVVDEDEKTMKVGKRVTLLDLFLADELDEKNAGKAKPAGEDDNENKAMKKKKKLILYSKLPAALVGKKGFSSKAKKLLPDVVDDDIRPLKKLHRFMTRMMKRKIHPDMEARLQKKAQGKLSDDVPVGVDGHDSTNEQDAANESVSLLLNQVTSIMV